MACGILVPTRDLNPGPQQWNHWTARKFLIIKFFWSKIFINEAHVVLLLNYFQISIKRKNYLIFQSFVILPCLASQSHRLWGPPRGYWCQQGRMQLQLGINMKICVKCVKAQLVRFQAFLCNLKWNLKQYACLKLCYCNYWAFTINNKKINMKTLKMKKKKRKDYIYWVLLHLCHWSLLTDI